MSGLWDSASTHRELIRLVAIRGRFRFMRTLDRMRSPRRILATSLTLVFFALYLVNGVFILSTRQPADPDRLRLWLSGGMVLYAVYHSVRCAWSRQMSDLEMSPAELLWLGGAPIRRSSLAVYHVIGLVVSAALKTALLVVVLAVDVAHLELLCLGVFASLLLLEIVRLTVARWAASISESTRIRFRIAITAIALVIVFQVIARVMAMTPLGSGTAVYVMNSFVALGQTAASGTIQSLSLPWICPAELAVAAGYRWMTIVGVLASMLSLPVSIWILVQIDRRSIRLGHASEQSRLYSGAFSCSSSLVTFDPFAFSRGLVAIRVLNRVGLSETGSLIARQWVSVKRYSGTIVFSFVVPTLLCLSPLATGKINDQWLFIVGGIALCTVLLAPPALRIDFRRDLKRMLLLRSLPVRPMSMVMGQLAIPVLITCLFQWITIAVAVAVIGPSWSSVILWTGMLSALALFTFAIENALFLAFPYHEHAEGIAMMIRAKLTFLGKATLLLIALGLLAIWSTWCRGHLSPTIAVGALVTGAVAVTWTLAAVSVIGAAWCWRRFDLSLDIPPQ